MGGPGPFFSRIQGPRTLCPGRIDTGVASSWPAWWPSWPTWWPCWPSSWPTWWPSWPAWGPSGSHNNNLRRATSTGSSPLWNVDAAPCSVSGEECSFLPSPADCATSIEQACGFQWHCPPWVWCTSTITEGLRREGRPEEDHLLLLLAGLFMYVRPLRRVLLW